MRNLAHRLREAQCGYFHFEPRTTSLEPSHIGKPANAMVDKKKYIGRFKELHHKKTGVWLSDDLAFEYFEKLVALVGTITSHTTPTMVTTRKYEGEEK